VYKQHNRKLATGAKLSQPGNLRAKEVEAGGKPLKITVAALWISLERGSISWSGRARAGIERPRDGEAGHGLSSARDGVEEESD